MAEPIYNLPTETQRELETFVTEWVNGDEVPGASVAVVRDDEVVFADGFGARDLEANEPATRETLYGIGSCTKSFTTLAVMQLAESGDLDPHDPVSEYVPYLDGVDGDPITTHELMSHTSGMPSDGSAVVLIARLMGTDPIEVPLSGEADFRRHLDGSLSERVFDDDQFFYYNSGFTVLGHLIEEVSGKSFTEYVNSEILDPLGMDRSTFSMDEVDADEDGLTPYYTEDGSTVEGKFPDDEMIYAAGGLLSSVSELTAYLRMNMNGGSYEGTELLSEDMIAQMHERHSTRQTALDGSREDYGYGWMISDLVGDTLVGHGGSIGVSNAFVGFLEESSVGVAIACNTAAKTHPMFIGPAVLSIVEGQEPAKEVPLFALREKIETVTGEYESYRGIQSGVVEQQGGMLELTLSTDLRSETYQLVPESLDHDEYRFYTIAESGHRIPVEFRQNEDGLAMTIQRWQLHKQD